MDRTGISNIVEIHEQASENQESSEVNADDFLADDNRNINHDPVIMSESRHACAINKGRGGSLESKMCDFCSKTPTNHCFRHLLPSSKVCVEGDRNVTCGMVSCFSCRAN